MTNDKQLVAPFPYFGGKRRAVDLVWPRFGNVKNYVEPFCGSLAILLGAPKGKRIETVNDVNGFIVNFWRAIKHDPEAVATWADWPVTEIDLEARHGWLVNRKERLRWSLQDPDFYDAKIAGWWVWGSCAWIGSGFCSGGGGWVFNGCEIFKGEKNEGFSRQLPFVGNAGLGINRQIPHLNAGLGINRQIPHLNAGLGINRRFDYILEWFESLSERLRDVRIVCGDWARVVTNSVTTTHGTTAIFLDPPYSAKANKIETGLYEREGEVSADVRKWCIENQHNPDLRIALCGYDGEHDLPGWTVINGKATNGGYGNQTGNQNHKKERIWLSPSCLKLESETQEEIFKE